MDEARNAKEYSWKYVTASELLSKTACDLCTVIMSSTVKAGVVWVYDGENTNGDIISPLEGTAARSVEWKPYKPIYCRRGLYVYVGDNVLGCFIQWRPRLAEEG